jgi:phospholipid/cholesterol/gamma-HCH transport system substrate-binding protein
VVKVINRKVQFIVGSFVIAGIFALLVLAFRISGMIHFLPQRDAYMLSAEFDNIGDLKVRAPVNIAGVTIGRVKAIELDHENFRARVTVLITEGKHDLPIDTAASILTQGLLGANYISLSPGFSEEFLQPNDTITVTHSALILENLLGQLIYTKPNSKSG